MLPTHSGALTTLAAAARYIASPATYSVAFAGVSISHGAYTASCRRHAALLIFGFEAAASGRMRLAAPMAYMAPRHGAAFEGAGGE